MRMNFAGLAAVVVAACGCGSSPGDAGATYIVGGSGGQGGGGAGGSGGSGGTYDGGSTACSLAGGEVRVTNAAGASSSPVVVWNGSAFLVAWSDERDGSGDLYAVEMSPDGTKLGSDAKIVGTPGASKFPSLAKVGTGFLVAWQDQTGTGETILDELLSNDGAPIGTQQTIASAQGQNGEARPELSAAFGGAVGGWMDTMAGTPSSVVTKLSAAGQPAQQVRLGTTFAVQYPSLAASDTTVVAVYSDARVGHLDVRAAMFDSGLVQTKDVVVRDASGDATNPRVIFDGTRFVSAWEDVRTGDEQIYAALIEPDGSVSTPLVVHDADTGSANWPALASNGSTIAIAYYQWRQGSPQIYVSALGSDGARIPGDLQVSSAPSGKARFPSIAYGAGQFGVVWEDSRFGDTEVFFARVVCQ